MDLEAFIGTPLHELSEEELDRAILTGRIAREEDMVGRQAKKNKGGGKKKEAAPVKVAVVSEDLDLDDMPEL